MLTVMFAYEDLQKELYQSFLSLVSAFVVGQNLRRIPLMLEDLANFFLSSSDFSHLEPLWLV